MNILILGAGRVGTGLVEALVQERNDITVIDQDPALLAALQERFDIRTVQGSASRLTVLEAAGAGDADALIAVTASDEVNLVACQLAYRRFNVPKRIARLRNPQWTEHEELLSTEGFAVDVAISPERSITESLMRLIEIPEALQVLDFAGGRVGMLAVKAEAQSPLVGHPVRDLRNHLPGVDARIVAIFRGNRVLLPDGDTVVREEDEVFLMAASEHLREVTHELRRMVDRPVKRVMIAGGGNIGLRLAEAISETITPKIIDGNPKRCEELARLLNGRALVLQGDATDEDLLEDEGVGQADLFLALTNDDENNIMSALLAKRLGARRVVALINRRAYADLVEGGQIDIALTPSHITLGSLLRHLRRGDVTSVHSLRRGAAEALELVAHGDVRTSKVVGRRLDQIDLPAGAAIGAIVRGEGEETLVLMAHRDVVVRGGDHLIVFVTNKKMIPRVERLFAVSAGFF